MPTIKGTQIRRIEAAGLTYVTENGAEEFIDFQQCYENYLARNTTPEHLAQMKQTNHMDDEQVNQYVAHLHKHKDVAFRGIDGFPWSENPCHGPCIAFHTSPTLRVEFDNSADFEDVRRMLRRLGWQTTDLS